MRIRREQITALDNAMARRFEDEMVAHLAKFSPPFFEAIKEDQMREAARFGIKKAGEYGFTLRGPIRLYLELMLLFGSHFDTDQQYPWANEILIDQESLLEMTRAETLHEKSLEYLKKVSGADAVNMRKALEELAIMVRNLATFPSNSFEAEIRQELNRMFPQKANYIGAKGLTALIHEGCLKAEEYGFSSVRGQALMVVLMYAFGHGCADDPLYPWISQTLNQRITEREEQIEKKALTWLERVLATL